MKRIYYNALTCLLLYHDAAVSQSFVIHVAKLWPQYMMAAYVCACKFACCCIKLMKLLHLEVSCCLFNTKILLLLHFQHKKGSKKKKQQKTMKTEEPKETFLFFGGFLLQSNAQLQKAMLRALQLLFWAAEQHAFLMTLVHKESLKGTLC